MKNINNQIKKITPGSILVIICLLFSLSASAQMVEGEDIPGFEKTFDVNFKSNSEVKAYIIKSSAPGSILWPGDELTVTIQINNQSDKEVTIKGSLKVIAYGTKGRPGDVWTPDMFKIADEGSEPINATIKARGFINLSFKPQVPARFGGYALVTNLGEHGNNFIGSYVRTFHVTDKKIQYPSFCLDDISNDVLQRLDTHAIRFGVEYKPTTDPDFNIWYSDLKKRLEGYSKANIAVMVEFGAPAAWGKLLPMGISRPWLNKKGITQDAKTDMAWLPQYDNDFEKLAYKIASDFGWPKGPVDAFDLWNEPWDGVSISGWGGDIPRYREIYLKMAKAVVDARKNAGVELLVGGTSSTSNAYDKLFADGSDSLLNRFDYCSIHYQGLAPSSTVKKWVDRKGPNGRVKIWDTESWVANTDDRVAAVVATDRSAGYDRAMGVYRGNICRIVPQKVRLNNDSITTTDITQTWSVAASIGASQHFIGERKFKEILFKNGLPWVMVFNGEADSKGKSNPDDGTIVIIGDIGDEFGADHLLFRTVRGLKELRHKEELKKQLALLDPSSKDEIAALKLAIDKDETLDDASLSFNDDNGKFILYDFYGNKVPAVNNRITIPLNGQGFFLRTDGSSNSFEKLTSAIGQSDIKGIEPLEIIPHDFQASIDQHPDLKLKLTNVLNCDVNGILNLTLKSLRLKDSSLNLSFKPHETKWINVKVLSGKVSPANTYAFNAGFQTKDHGFARHDEDLHVNVIAKRTINVDGNLKDWENIIPQIIKGDNQNESSLTEAAWFPFKQFNKNSGEGLASGYLAYDDKYFYFAAKVADQSPDEGMPRFETRDINEDFYPAKVLVPYDHFRFGGAMMQPGISYSVKWSGILKPKYAGNYKLTLNARADMALWINNVLVYDNRYRTGKDKTTFSIYLNKANSIKTEFSKNYDEAGIQLLWEGPHQDMSVIPASCFFHIKNGKLLAGLTGQYFNGPAFNALRVTRTDAQLNFKWADKEVPDSAFIKQPLAELNWPKGVRRYSYRNDPSLPSGNFQDHDNIQIAFNVLDEDKKDRYPNPPGTMPGYTTYQCTDYEYALNPVAAKYGGGTEIWRLRVPGMPHKHFFPRQGVSPFDGPVKNGKLAITRDGGTRIVEAAIPWSEIPDVKSKLDKGLPIKFSYRVNDNTPHGSMELSRKRSVAKINESFMVDWKEHWANELEFSFLK